jgi:hypothetical protein
VYRFDRTLIDPTPEVLDVTLAAAAEAANRGFHVHRLKWPDDGFAEFVAGWRRASVEPGQRQWLGGGVSLRTGAGRDTRSVAAAAWWLDRLGRRHCRVVAARVQCGTASESDLLQPFKHDTERWGERPILWRVYPDDLYLRQQRDGWGLWAACRCGAAGTPEELGWMGPCCAACHDRSEEGAAPDRSPVTFTRPAAQLLTAHADVAFGLGGRVLLARDWRSPRVHVWDVGTTEHRTLSFGRGLDEIGTLSVSPDGRVAAACVGVVIFVWTLTDDRVLVTLPMPSAGGTACCVSLVFSPDGSSLAVAGGGNRGSGVELYDLFSDKARWSVPFAQGLFVQDSRSLTFTPDGRQLALPGGPGTIGLFDAADGSRTTLTLEGRHAARAIAFSPDGKTLVTAIDYNNPDDLRAYDVGTGRQQASLPEPAAYLAFSPDGRTLAAAGRDGRLRLVDAGTFRLIASLRWHQGDLSGVAFSPDGRWLATCAHEARVKLWPVDALLREPPAGRRSVGRTRTS